MFKGLEKMIRAMTLFDLLVFKAALEDIKQDKSRIDDWFLTETIPEEICECGNTKWRIFYTFWKKKVLFIPAFCAKCGNVKEISRANFIRAYRLRTAKEWVEMYKETLEEGRKLIKEVEDKK